MRALTADELGRMRDTQAVSLPETCTIQLVTVTQDDIGQPVKTYSTRTASVACRLAARSSLERLLGEKTTSVGDWVLTLDHAQAIAVTDRVIIGARTFDVVAVNTAHGWQLCRRVDLVEIT